jgi:hypothetical protein
MATRKSGSRGGNVSLSDTDRQYFEESLGEARSRGAEAGSEGASGLFEALESFGLSSERVDRLREALGKVEVRESVEKAQEYLADQIESARGYARDNPKKVIGGAAGVLVGASLLAYALRRAGEEKPKSRSTSGGGSSSSSSSTSSKSSGKSSSSKKRSSGGSSKKSPGGGGSKKESKKR